MATDPRTTVSFWETQRRACEQYLEPVLQKFALYAQWYSGSLDSLQQQIASALGIDPIAGAPFINLVTRTSRAEMFYRAPRYLVEPIERFGPSVFTQDLAQLETVLLNDFVEETNLFRQGRRVILDMLLAHRGIFKLGYTADIAVDYPLVNENREKAQLAARSLIEGGKSLPKPKKDDLHTVWIETIAQIIAAIEREDIVLDEENTNKLRAHINARQKILDKYSERPKETIRYEHVWVKRVNPMRFRFDPFAEDPSQRTWVGEIFVRETDEIRNDDRYDAKARSKVQATDLNAISGMELDTRYDNLTESTEQIGRTACVEIVDIKRRKVITYAIGGTEPLRIRDYVMANILPDGPYVDESFTEDPLDDVGIPQPQVYQNFQVALAVVDAVLMEIAKRSVPRQAVDPSAFSKDELNKLRKNVPGGILALDQLRQGGKVSDMIQDIPSPKIENNLLQIRALLVRAIEQYSGLGSAKLAGGDFAKTATASAIIGESVATLTEDLNSVIDNVMSRVGKKALRIIRLFYDTPKVAEIAGEVAAKAWPKFGWAPRDIVMDRGANMVPGSTKRKNIAVEQKLLTELYSILAQDPILPPNARVDLLKRLLDAVGIFGLDITGADRQAMEERLAQEQAQQAARSEQGPDPAQRTERRATSGSEPSRAAIEQGNANPGGGRVPTGASAGDNPRGGVSGVRKKAMNSIKGRGG